MNAEQDNHSPYAGRWVALVRGRVVAQGGTPEQALRTSQSSRYKERPEIRFMPVPFSLPPLIEKIKGILPSDLEVYLVGGAVRDFLTSRLSPDLDFSLPSSGISLARKIANQLNADFMVLDDERDTGRVILTNEDGTFTYLDFATFRGANLEEDLRDRDFTINAIAYDMRNGTVLDPLDGANDIRAKVIRVCDTNSIVNDPIRILRGVRQAAAFGFTIDKDTRVLMKSAANQIGRVSAERIRDEFFKILEGPKASASIRALDMLGVLGHITPELLRMKNVTQSAPHIYDVWAHTLAVMDSLDGLLSALRIDFDAEKTSDMFIGMISLKIGRYRDQIASHLAEALNPTRSHRSLLFMAALYHDVCKPDTKSMDEDGRIHFYDHDQKGAEVIAERARSFNLSNDEIEWLNVVVRQHMRIHGFASRLEYENKPPSRRAIYRFFRDSGRTGVDLVLLSLSDIRGTRGTELTQLTWSTYLDVARILLENYWEHPAEVIDPPRLLDGNELMEELNLQPGQVIGQLLESIRENQAAGKIIDKEQAIAFAKEEYLKLKGV